MNAELIAVGSELTSGASLDTNSQWLSRELEGRGWNVTRHTTIADDLPAIVETLQAAAVRSRLVLLTGGLGPTRDDITREALSTAFEQPLVEDDDSLAHIAALFARLGRRMWSRNRVQALRPRDAVPIRNNHGTAPGILMQLSDCSCVMAALPGVPREMKLMFEEQLAAHLPATTAVVRRVVLRTFGFGESHAEERLGDLTERGRNPEVGITASAAVISLSVTARGASEKDCDHLLQPVLKTIHERLGNAVFGFGSDELHTVVRDLLAQKNVTLSLSEGSTTGGLLSQWLSSEQPNGACVVIEDGLIPGTQDTSDLLTLCGSAGTAADYAVATSHASAASDSDGEIVVKAGQIAVVGPGLKRVVDVDFAGNLGIFRERAARIALNVLRLHLLSEFEPTTTACSR